MDKSKLNSLLAWVNSTGAGPCLESLEELQNSEHFIKLICRRNGDGNDTSYCETPTQRYRHITAFITDFYNIKSNSAPFNYEDILNRRHIGEISKLTALIMCACCFGTNNEQFVVGIEKLDLNIQQNIMDIMQHIILKDDQDDISLADNYVDILYQGGSDLSEVQTPVFSSISSTSSVFSTTPRASAAASPLRAFISSPQVKQKIMARRRHEQHRKVESQLVTERAMRLDLEEELKERNNIISKQKSKIETMDREVQRLRQNHLQWQAIREEEFSNQLDVMKQTVQEKGNEVAGLKMENVRLQEETKRLNAQLMQLESQMTGHQNLASNHQNVQKALRETEAENFKLKAEFGSTKEELILAKQELDNWNRRYEEMENIVKTLQEKLATQSGDERSVMSPTPRREPLGVVSDFKIVELEEHIQRLLANSEQDRKTFQETLQHHEKTHAARVHQMEIEHSNALAEVKKQMNEETELMRQEGIRNCEQQENNRHCEQLEKSKMEETNRLIVETTNLKNKMESEMESLKQQINVKVEEIQHVQQESIRSCDQLEKAKIEEINRITVKRTEEMSRMESEMESLKQQLKTRVEEIEQVQKENNRCSEQLEKSKMEEINRLQENNSEVVNKLEGENENLKQQLKARVDEIELIRLENMKSCEQLEKSKMAEISDLVAKKTEEINRMESLKVEEITKLQQASESKADEIDKLTQAHKEAYTQVKQLQDIREAQTAEISKMKAYHEEQMAKMEQEKATLQEELKAQTATIQQLTAQERMLQEANDTIENLKAEVERKQTDIEQKDSKCQILECDNKQLRKQVEQNASEVDKLRTEANKWIMEKNQEVLACTSNTEKVMAAVKEREIAIQELQTKMQEKEEELVASIQEGGKLTEEKLALERQMEEHTEAFQKGMTGIQGKLIALSKQQKEQETLETRIKKLTRDKGALEAKLERLLKKAKVDQTQIEKQVGNMEQEMKLLNELKDDAVVKADEARKENEQMHIEIQDLQTKLTCIEKELREEKAANFKNFSAVEYVQSMESIANDSLGDLSPDELNVSQASNASSKSGFNIGLPTGHRFSVWITKSEKKKSSKRKSPRNNTPTNIPTPTAEQHAGSILHDSFSSFEQPSFSTASSQRESLRSFSRSTPRESILPPLVDDTIDQLAQSKPAFLRNSALQQSMRSSRQTTVVNDCDDEPDPDLFDWNRLAELQCRNTLCLPHQRTSYPVEVQMRPTQEMSENDLQTGNGVLTRSGKRKSMEKESFVAPPKIMRPSSSLSSKDEHQKEFMEISPCPLTRGKNHRSTEKDAPFVAPPKTRITRTASEMSDDGLKKEFKEPSTAVIRSRKPKPMETELPAMPPPMEPNRRESIMLSVGFSPKQRKGRSRKSLASKNATNSGKSTPQRKKSPKKRAKTPKGKKEVKEKKRKTPGKKRRSFFFGLGTGSSSH